MRISRAALQKRLGALTVVSGETCTYSSSHRLVTHISCRTALLSKKFNWIFFGRGIVQGFSFVYNKVLFVAVALFNQRGHTALFDRIAVPCDACVIFPRHSSSSHSLYVPVASLQEASGRRHSPMLLSRKSLTSCIMKVVAHLLHCHEPARKVQAVFHRLA